LDDKFFEVKTRAMNGSRDMKGMKGKGRGHGREGGEFGRLFGHKKLTKFVLKHVLGVVLERPRKLIPCA
jgi:hypothetical protein